MSPAIISQPYGLRLIPVTSIRIVDPGLPARIEILDDPWIVPLVSGSLQIGDTPNGIKFSKQHRFRVRNVSLNKDKILRLYSSVDLVAFYVDASGVGRMSGSLSTPLRLLYQETSGYYDCQLTGDSADSDSIVDFSSLFSCLR